MVPPAPPAPWMGRSSSSPSLREPELRESEPMVPADFPSTLRRVRRGAPSRANIAVGTTRTTSSTAAAGSTGHTGMHRDRGRAAEELLELVDAREDLTAARAYLRASTAGQAVQAAAPPAPPVRKLQRSKQGHFTVLRRTSNVRRPRQAQEIDVSPEAVDPYAASFAATWPNGFKSFHSDCFSGPYLQCLASSVTCERIAASECMPACRIVGVKCSMSMSGTLALTVSHHSRGSVGGLGRPSPDRPRPRAGDEEHGLRLQLVQLSDVSCSVAASI